MAISRTLFKNPFRVNFVPGWICPTCNTGILKAENKHIKTFENSYSLNLRSEDYWEIEMLKGIFLGLLKCNNSNCNETVAFTGEMNMREEQEYDEQHDRWNMVGYEYLSPTFFNPPLNLFPLNKDLPKNIAAEIGNAFNIYWFDLSSCANKIRVVIELIMDDRKVVKKYMDNGRRKVYSLHRRIEFFRIKNPEEAELLMAIKWIGNSGSHTNDTLTKDDILDGFDILEHVAIKLYDTENDRIKKLSKTINKRKKPVGSIKRKGTK